MATTGLPHFRSFMICKQLGWCCVTKTYRESGGKQGGRCKHLIIEGTLGKPDSTRCGIYADRPFVAAVEVIDNAGDPVGMMPCVNFAFPETCCGGLLCNTNFGGE